MNVTNKVLYHFLYDINRYGILFMGLVFVLAIIYMVKKRPFEKVLDCIFTIVGLFSLLLGFFMNSLNQSAIYERRYSVDAYISSEWLQRWQDSLWFLLNWMTITLGIFLFIKIITKNQTDKHFLITVSFIFIYAISALVFYLYISLKTDRFDFNPLTMTEGMLLVISAKFLFDYKKHKRIFFIMNIFALVQLLFIFANTCCGMSEHRYNWYSYVLMPMAAFVPCLVPLYNIVFTLTVSSTKKIKKQ